MNVEFSATRRSARPRAAVSALVPAPPNSSMAAIRSAADGVMPVLVKSASTNCAGAIVEGIGSCEADTLHKLGNESLLVILQYLLPSCLANDNALPDLL